MTSFNYHHAVKTQVMNHGIMYNIQYNCNATFFIYGKEKIWHSQGAQYLLLVSVLTCVLLHICNLQLLTNFITNYQIFYNSL